MSPSSGALSGARSGALSEAACDVLVVGAGPSGLFAACELLRRGVNVRIIDRADGPSTVPKALALWPRALDLLADLGIAGGLREAAEPVRALSYFSGGSPLARFEIPEKLRPLHLPQYETERLLNERLEQLGGKVERGVRLLNFDADAADPGAVPLDGDHVLTALVETGDSALRRLPARYVIGADGASSTVRGLLGTGFQGTTYPLTFALTDTRVRGRLPAGELLYYQAPTGTLMIAPLPDGIFRVLVVLPRAGQQVTQQMMQRYLDERGPGGVTLTEAVWTTVYRVHARQATEYRRGRIFLAGDAAHVHSPAGGQGMNNGLQDAHNLAWKLAAVLHGESPPTVLEDYTPERRYATDRIIAATDRQTRAWMAGSRPRIVLRDAAFRLAGRSGLVPRQVFPVMAGRRVAYPADRDSQRPAGRTRCGLLERLPGRLRIGMVFPRATAVAHGFAGSRPGSGSPAGWTLVTVEPVPGLRPHRLLADYPQVTAVRLASREAGRATGCRAPGYYLVRPDGHIAAHGHAGDAARLDTELRRHLLPQESRS
ncbi:FAD-dependent oxidoreductase [Streptomyces aidingensis]|uniref:3-(3-hydroxy-phenyl)propionate hydroxylase n=1 Tax=Streptomyces aidingensis TaxID=910347 RepID=A0A1I1FGN4_9ACTN|nr:FAD-dependent monooxygenase [Streptomyces aidingensis]SFB98096.1 3-(3-hydroxy-phenyl)propionate hydroxylase [Streptomyces aidingensis]